MSYVIDASAVADLLVAADGEQVAAAIGDDDLYAPQLIIPEVLSVFRKWLIGGHITEQRAAQAIDDLVALDWELVDMQPLAHAIWELRHNVSSYDAAYIALGTVMECPVLTRDGRLARAMPDVTQRC